MFMDTELAIHFTSVCVGSCLFPLPEYLVIKKGMDKTQQQRKRNEAPSLDLDMFHQTVIKKEDKCQTTLYVFK